MRPNSARLFNLGADLYGWFTAQAAWRASCARMAAHLPADARRIADLGCGPGVSAIEIARLHPVGVVLGVDVAPRMLAQARRRLARARLPTPERVRWILGDVAGLPFASASLDALTGHSFLYLLPDRSAALAEMLRILRPGGRLVLMEPNRRAATVRGVLRVSRDPRHLLAVSLWRPFSRVHGRFSAASLAATLAEAGFARCGVEETLGGLGLLARAEKPANGVGRT